MVLTLASLGFGSLAGLSIVEYATIIGAAVGAIAVSREAVKEIRARLNGSKTLEKNAAGIYRHAFNYKVVEGYINRENGPRSLLLETPGRIYYAVKGKNPSVVILKMSNKDDIAKYQNIMLHLDDPEKAYNIGVSEFKNGHRLNSDICIRERKEWGYKLRERGWLRKISGANYSKVDKAMHMHVEALIETKNTSPNMSACCHLGIKHSHGDNYDLIVTAVSKNFTKAVKKKYNKTIKELAQDGDNIFFENILEVRRDMSGYKAPAQVATAQAPVAKP